jgi:predicted ArsR family transcriptional regulator
MLFVLLDKWRSSLPQIGKNVMISEPAVVRHLTNLRQSKFKHL